MLNPEVPFLHSVIKRLLGALTTAQSPAGKVMFDAMDDDKLPAMWCPLFYELLPEPVHFGMVYDKLYRYKYTTLAEFGEDVAKFLSQCRYYMAHTTKMHKDAVLMHREFIQEVKKVTKELKIKSKIAAYTDKSLDADLEVEKQRKSAHTKRLKSGTMIEEGMLAAWYFGRRFVVGEYVYLAQDGQDGQDPPLIGQITTLNYNDDKQLVYTANRFFRPCETRHEAKRSFWKTEVFASVDELTGTMDSIVGTCWVWSFKDFCELTAKNIHEKDQYCCESRYISKGQGKYAKLTSLHFPPTDLQPEKVDREVKLLPKHIPRMPSMHAKEFNPAEHAPDKLAAIKGRLAKQRASSAVPKQHVPEVRVADEKKAAKDASEGIDKAFSVFHFRGTEYRVGSFVLARNVSGKPKVLQIERIYIDRKMKRWFKGRRFLFPKGLGIDAIPEDQRTTAMGVITATHPGFPKELIALQERAPLETVPMRHILKVCELRTPHDFDRPRRLDLTSLEGDVYVTERRFDPKKLEARKMQINNIKWRVPWTELPGDAFETFLPAAALAPFDGRRIAAPKPTLKPVAALAAGRDQIAGVAQLGDSGGGTKAAHAAVDADDATMDTDAVDPWQAPEPVEVIDEVMLRQRRPRWQFRMQPPCPLPPARAGCVSGESGKRAGFCVSCTAAQLVRVSVQNKPNTLAPPPYPSLN